MMTLWLLAGFPAGAQQTGSWGDQGNGTYINPILNADYSDPDVIRVGKKYYMICSEFHFMGMTIQESDDMVNWKIVGRVYEKLDFPAYDRNERYAGGSWAPALRYHDGKFWVFFCTINEGLFMTQAPEATGPWAPLTLVGAVEKWEDPCPFWDDDGQAYLGHSVHGAGPIIIHRMSPDGTRLLDDGRTVYTGPVAEGTKIHKWNGWYYLSIPEGGVERGWQTVLRSKSIYGPYEKRVVLETGSTTVNGPHQGSIVDTPEGEWWFFHFQAAGPVGRVMHLQPVHWHDGWPVMGVDMDRNGIGEPVYVWKKPETGSPATIFAPQSDDDFGTTQLGLQWQWNHNPAADFWSLTRKPGWLSLTALPAPTLREARNTLTQKVMGLTGEAVVKMDPAAMTPGQKAGMACMSNLFHSTGVVNREGTLHFFFEGTGMASQEVPLKKGIVWLKVKLNLKTQKNQFYYSSNGQDFLPIGGEFQARWGHWKGSRIALFSYLESTGEPLRPAGSTSLSPGNGHHRDDRTATISPETPVQGGMAAFDWFRYEYDGPK